MDEIEIEGQVYSIGKMDVFTQFHVVRRLGPLAPTILAYLEKPKEERQLLDLFYPLMGLISTLSDADTDYILHQCLATVTRKQAGGWAKVQSAGGLMFDDITMPTMLKLTWEVILKDIASFFPTSPAILAKETPPA